MKTFRVIISYTVTEDTYIEAESAEQARELVSNGEVQADWSTIATDDWDVCEVLEVE